MKRTVRVAGEAVKSPMYLTCIGAAERPHAQARVGLGRNHAVAPGCAEGGV